jgi:hypothetical protein
MSKDLVCLTGDESARESAPAPALRANPTIGFSDGAVFEILPHLRQSFWLRAGKGDGCWNWLGARNHDGYGLVSGYGIGRLVRAHRLSYAIHHGHLSPDEKVLHRCNNRRCVNPDHLYSGTIADNSLDMMASRAGMVAA